LGLFLVKAAFFFVSIVLVVLSDQWTKSLILARFEYGESLALVRDWFSLTYVRNTGAAFGFLANAHPSFRVPFFLVIPIIATAVLGLLYRDLPKTSRYRAMSLGLVSGGALGNLIDRIRLGYVVDFLDFHWKTDWYFPAFNVADSAICVGVGILLIASLKKEEEVRAPDAP
jgi:signal peptidase II